jgi:SAM-dependent methyltransferase
MNTTRLCRLCRGTRLEPLLSLDGIPISHYLRKRREDPDPRFRLAFEYCAACGLLQIADAIPADLIYGETDTYTTGFQKPRHLDDLITTTIARQDPGRAIDIGCNDGAFMEALKRAGYAHPVGIEPNRVAAAAASAKGFKVYNDYLTRDLAMRAAAEDGPFDAVFLRHVVEHVGDLDAFFAAIGDLLRDGGLLVMELPYVEEAFGLGSPAILWEEHLSYFTEAQAAYLLARFGFRICDSRRYVFGGGSSAYVAQKLGPGAGAPARPDPAASIAMLRRFAERLARQRGELGRLVGEAKAAGYKVAIYGAAPRSCLVVAACGIADAVDFVIDDRAEIQNRLMPGTDRVIRPLSDLGAAPGDKLLCLLGVGSENEFKVRAKLEAAIGPALVSVSLFPPRDALQSVAAASRLISVHRN